MRCRDVIYHDGINNDIAMMRRKMEFRGGGVRRGAAGGEGEGEGRWGAFVLPRMQI